MGPLQIRGGGCVRNGPYIVGKTNRKSIEKLLVQTHFGTPFDPFTNSLVFLHYNIIDCSILKG